MGSALSQQLISLIREGLTLDPGLAFHSDQLLPRLYDLSLAALLAFLPLLGLLLLVAVSSPLLLNGWLFSLKPLQPNFGKLNPLNGIGRMFSQQSDGTGEGCSQVDRGGRYRGLGDLAQQQAVLMLVSEPLAIAIPHLGSLVWGSFAAIMGGMLLIVAVDVPFQLWEHNKKLKMTKEEVRQESKETEGDPQVKARIRSMQREMARRRMMAEIRLPMWW